MRHIRFELEGVGERCSCACFADPQARMGKGSRQAVATRREDFLFSEQVHVCCSARWPPIRAAFRKRLRMPAHACACLRQCAQAVAAADGAGSLLTGACAGGATCLSQDGNSQGAPRDQAADGT